MHNVCEWLRSAVRNPIFYFLWISTLCGLLIFLIAKYVESIEINLKQYQKVDLFIQSNPEDAPKIKEFLEDGKISQLEYDKIEALITKAEKRHAANKIKEVRMIFMRKKINGVLIDERRTNFVSLFYVKGLAKERKYFYESLPTNVVIVRII